ncbi:hypothetical protein [Caballeronia sp. LZ016]|uniref:hypothetical protein n=1 Tax=Caballeronia sp. LZ016 TaxID=3038554 RepID=UPI002864CF4C|nr:hypothetical protein [Caballeronia sp. LZ016]MDR5740073.1 hypothetical protein [Caballeronia sp. LZ016]
MTKVLSVRLTVEEEAAMRRQMALSGDREIGPHIKRIYFGQLHPGEGVLAELQRNSELALDMLATLGRNARRVDCETEPNENNRDTELRLLAAIFTMIYSSIGKLQQALIGRYVDHQVVEDFLKAKG